MSKTYVRINFPGAAARLNNGAGAEVRAIFTGGSDETAVNFTDDENDTVALSASNMYVGHLGYFILREIEFSIGGQLIDKHYSNWLHIWHELSVPNSKQAALDIMVGKNYTDYSLSRVLYVPLIFFFNRFESMALPLIALQYHEVRFTILFENYQNLIAKVARDAMDNYTPAGATEPNQLTPIPDQGVFDASLYIDYIFLDTSERRKFAQSSHEYLICQLQHTGVESINQKTTNLKLNFNHPVKELIWVFQSEDHFGPDYRIDKVPHVEDELRSSVNIENHTDGEGNVGPNPLYEARLQFNGHDRFTTRRGIFFDVLQPYQHHTRMPSERGINLYSFSLYPQLEQPSGSSNFSRIDNATLIFTLKQGADPTNTSLGDAQPSQSIIRMYAVNFNILRIMSGMGGLAYSN